MNSSFGLAHLAIGNGRSSLTSHPVNDKANANSDVISSSTKSRPAPTAPVSESCAANDEGTPASSTSATSHVNANNTDPNTIISNTNEKSALLENNLKTNMSETTAASPATASASGLTQRRKKGTEENENDSAPIEPQHDDATIQQLRKAFQRKYRHVAAIHSVTQPSCLSHDSKVSPSFLGFRNLMVIVLGAFSFGRFNPSPLTTVCATRTLMLTNYQSPAIFV